MPMASASEGRESRNPGHPRFEKQTAQSRESQAMRLAKSPMAPALDGQSRRSHPSPAWRQLCRKTQHGRNSVQYGHQKSPGPAHPRACRIGPPVRRPDSLAQGVHRHARHTAPCRARLLFGAMALPGCSGSRGAQAVPLARMSLSVGRYPQPCPQAATWSAVSPAAALCARARSSPSPGRPRRGG